jgi:hypothetical protein
MNRNYLGACVFGLSEGIQLVGSGCFAGFDRTRLDLRDYKLSNSDVYWFVLPGRCGTDDAIVVGRMSFAMDASGRSGFAAAAVAARASRIRSTGFASSVTAVEALHQEFIKQHVSAKNVLSLSASSKVAALQQFNADTSRIELTAHPARLSVTPDWHDCISLPELLLFAQDYDKLSEITRGGYLLQEAATGRIPDATLDIGLLNAWHAILTGQNEVPSLREELEEAKSRNKSIVSEAQRLTTENSILTGSVAELQGKLKSGKHRVEIKRLEGELARAIEEKSAADAALESERKLERRLVQPAAPQKAYEEATHSQPTESQLVYPTPPPPAHDENQTQPVKPVQVADMLTTALYCAALALFGLVLTIYIWPASDRATVVASSPWPAASQGGTAPANRASEDRSRSTETPTVAPSPNAPQQQSRPRDVFGDIADLIGLPQVMSPPAAVAQCTPDALKTFFQRTSHGECYDSQCKTRLYELSKRLHQCDTDLPKGRCGLASYPPRHIMPDWQAMQVSKYIDRNWRCLEENGCLNKLSNECRTLP